ncbi:NVEALA domain-containing protein [Tannerella forsythia]|uniref:Uncharacterized protein n=2 Tax=Tannerella forsythia TaxID=28112 RepID=A0A2A6E7B0_TANFO|nr:NVEALA domain-containing protein [Tannerella forsythia]PDP43216.1 hypothetical protein CLI86_09640 [Tannerella forsythia]
MKRIMLSAIFMLATATVTIWNMYKNRTVTKLSGLTLDNIEALASEDGGGGAGVYFQENTIESMTFEIVGNFRKVTTTGQRYCIYGGFQYCTPGPYTEVTWTMI